ncbi:MAG: TcfC E-set like domain-containing protein [Cellvibrionaceae bacterium]
MTKNSKTRRFLSKKVFAFLARILAEKKTLTYSLIHCFVFCMLVSTLSLSQDTLEFKIEPPIIDLSFPKPEPILVEDAPVSIDVPDFTLEPIDKSSSEIENKNRKKEIANKNAELENIEPEQTTSNKKEPKKKRQAKVPPGFESLSEPQTTIVDIYFGDEYLISQLATYTADEITLSNSNVIIAKIPTILDTESVQGILDSPLPTNVELACFYEGQNNCGNYTPRITGVIFNENSFRVDLFINSDYLSVRTAGHRKYIPASDGDWSLLQNLSAAYAGSTSSRPNNSSVNLSTPVNSDPNIESNNNNYSINSHSTLAFKENRFQLLANLRDNGDNESENNIDTAVFRRDWQGLEYQVGYFRGNSSSFQFMGDNPIRGLRFASSLDTREDLRQTSGNELQVFLTSRSEVLIFKDDRLISSRFYDAGNQILDTRQLPGGAYDVQIKIIGAGGVTSEETRFYIKSNQLPPIDQPLYFIEAGEILNSEDTSGLANASGKRLIRGGYHYRFLDQIGAMAGISHTSGSLSSSDNLLTDNEKNISLTELEFGVTHLGKYHDLSIGGFAGNENRHGARFNLRTRFSGLFFNANYRRVWNDNFDPSATLFENDLLSEPSTQASVSFTSLLPFGRVELNGRLNRRFDNTIETYTARFDFPRLRFGFSELYTGIQTSREEGTSTTLFTMELRFNKKHITAQLRPEYSTEKNSLGETKSGLQSYGIVSWHDRDLLQDKDLRIDVRGQNIDSQSGIGSEVDFATQAGRIRLQAERYSLSSSSSTTSTNSTEGTRINGNGFTSFMINRNSIKLGGKDQSQSALLVKINGDISDATFDVIIDDSRRGIAYPNKTTAINLRPFSTYKVRLAQRGTSFVEYEQIEKEVTLYPGNVVTLEWNAAELNVVFGKIIDQNGKPVKNALIKGVSGIATTDEYGLFQAEIRSDVNNIRVETTTSECGLQLPDYTVKKRIASLGTLSCVFQEKP